MFMLKQHNLKIALFFICCTLFACQPEQEGFQQHFDSTADRIWIGEDFWAIPMEDWQVSNGRIELLGNHPDSRVHVLTQEMQEEAAEFTAEVHLGLLNTEAQQGRAGLLLGVHDPVDTDVKAAAYYGEGLPAGVSADGSIFIGETAQALPENFDLSDLKLRINGQPEEESIRLTLTAEDTNGQQASMEYLHSENLQGLVSLFNRSEEGGRFWFDDISLSGPKIQAKEENAFGPILWAMHTLDKGTFRLTAQMPPLGADDAQVVSLQIRENDEWQEVQQQPIESISRTALFTLSDWNSQQDTDYRLVYANQEEEHFYEGTIRQEPQGRPLVMAGLTCQNGNGYPYTPLVMNLQAKNPDMLYFSGDQLYEGNGGYPIKREPEDMAVLSYLGKWYMFGWAFRDLMRNAPTVTTPDDHDVFQGNLWGEGGELRTIEEWNQRKDAYGGYVQSPKMVNAVARTQCGHLPPPPDTSPVESGIDVWYSHLTYGGVSFAIISDRMFKSGPEEARPDAEGRIDHVKEPMAAEILNPEGLDMLGQRQLDFLENWVTDWEGASMKALLSQTVFANIATHHGGDRMLLYGDLDSGGWPKSPRDRVVELMRKAFALHINGDQHVPFLVHYGLDACSDAGWSFCTPAISTGYERRFHPDRIGFPITDRPEHGLDNTGCYEDVFGNRNMVYAVGNPEDDVSGENRYIRARRKASGYGLISFDTQERSIRMDAYKFPESVDQALEDTQFPGWPHTIRQEDNFGKTPYGFLPTLELEQPDQLVQVQKQDGALVYALRIKGQTFAPEVFEAGQYTIIVGEGEQQQEFNGLRPESGQNNETLSVILESQQKQSADAG
jgi:phosphodiesterase/alkaline phosphatase D-like protein